MLACASASGGWSTSDWAAKGGERRFGGVGFSLNRPFLSTLLSATVICECSNATLAVKRRSACACDSKGNPEAANMT